MRIFTFILFSVILNLAACQLGFAGLASDPISFGAWSEPTNGLRGRLLFAEGIQLKEGARLGLVYLELQNVSPGESLYVYYAVMKSPLKCELRDSDGKAVKNSLGAGGEGIPRACWLTLPLDSTLRFLTGSSGSAPDYPCLFVVSAWVGGKWAIPATATNDYYLSGTFSSMSPTNETRSQVWEGTLKLPPVRISVKSP
jgi:hypothetical protein